MSASEIERTLIRLAHEIVEKNNGIENLAFVGIKRRGAPLGPLPDLVARQGSSVVLGRRGKGLVAYVADRDRERIAVVDLATQKVAGSVSVLGAPEQVVILDDGRVVVTVGNRRHIEVFQPSEGRHAPLERLCAREVPAGPFGLRSYCLNAHPTRRADRPT